MYSPKNQLIASYRSGLREAKSHLNRLIYLEKRLTLNQDQKQRVALAKKIREAQVKQWELLIELEEKTLR